MSASGTDFAAIFWGGGIAIVASVVGALIGAGTTLRASRREFERAAASAEVERERERLDLLAAAWAELDVNTRAFDRSIEEYGTFVLFELNVMLAATTAIASLDEGLLRDVL